MEIRLAPYITLRTGTFAAVVAPEEAMISLFAEHPELKRYLFLYISGNGSRLLTRAGDRSATFDVRRAFTAHQLLTILREATHTIIFIEHDPTLFESGGSSMAAAIGKVISEAASGSLVILYTPVPDRFFGEMAAYADRIITLAPEEAPVRKQNVRASRFGQATLGAF
ncbi:hypothetical protein FTO68_05715 [Methanocalculus taiwanensis]|uniref:Uncharacterized protein n=1 Tax=Methanocalculus taiwanensis TaxID=106207 RepID=A0ABD4THR2_9EURY|nr:hypothetical protein [Methanocalculus taiwanensis]MCQ1538483.1 hypothetical protein [Methanocalculus taiwanensis]